MTLACDVMQAEPPEEDMDVRGGGPAADDRRIVKDGYASDGALFLAVFPRSSMM